MRLFAVGQINEQLSLAQRLLAWLHGSWTEPTVSLPEIYRLGPNAIRTKEVAAAMVGILEEHGWLARIQGGAVIAGARRREAWRIVKEVAP